MTFGERLNQLYIEHGYDKKLAKVFCIDMRISQSQKSEYLAGVKEPTAVTSRRLAKGFGITISELWEGVE